MSNFKIAWMFPDTLCLHGERGNILALKRFAAIGGFNPVVDKIDFDTEGFDPMEYQVIFFAPGEISSFPQAIRWLSGYIDGLKQFMESGRVLLATGTSVAMFGEKTERVNGETINALGLLDASYKEKPDVYGDDVDFVVTFNKKEIEVIGNQIQMGDLILRKEKEFGRLLYGYGNTSEDRKEGAQAVNSIFTNTLGPMLVCNPRLTIEIIKASAVASGLTANELALDEYDDSLERKSFDAKKRFIENKETDLKNCPHS